MRKRTLRVTAALGIVTLLVVLLGALAAAAFPGRILRLADYGPATERLVTGILVAGTSAQPVVYVSSSDPRTGADNRHDRAMDTNSGIVSRLTLTPRGWKRVDLVRGLPRSRQDHATNGLALDPSTQTLYVAQGSNTNRGSPSESFGFLPESPLSAAVLAIDLTRIGDATYDLPTRSDQGLIGGRGGVNATFAPPGAPVRVVATGLRNPYDIARTSSGALFATINGANAGRGGRPVGDCSNAVREGGAVGLDRLVRLRRGAFYGHPNPSRGECGRPTDAALSRFPFSTNGITEVTAGPVGGDLLTVSFDGTMRRSRLDETSSRVLAHEDVSLGGIPLDVTAQGQDDPLPGTIWVASYIDQRGRPGGLAVLEPRTLGRVGPWAALPGTGSPRQEVSYVEYDGRLFLAGGGTEHQVFDPRTGRWSNIAPLPVALDHIQGAVVGDRIYYVGGLRSWPDEEVGSVLVYDPALNRFSRGPTMPRPRGAGGVAVHGGKLYYAGGLSRGRAVPWLDVLDPTLGRWSKLADMPRQRDHFQAVFAGDRLLVTGGRNRDIGTERDETDYYDVGERQWTTGLAPLPTPRGGFGAVFVRGEMIVIGGEVPGRTLPTVEAYDVARDTWRALPSMPTPRHGIQAALCGDRVLVAAGGVRAGGGPSDAHEELAVGPIPCGRPSRARDEVPQTLKDGYVIGSIAGAVPLRPTSLQFGPDGRLYVAQQNGAILALTVRRRAAGAYEIVATEEIDLVRAIPNHDDDGSSATDFRSLLQLARDRLGS